MIANLLRDFTIWLEIRFDRTKDMGTLTLSKLYEVNAAADRNYWFDKHGNRWPLRDSL